MRAELPSITAGLDVNETEDGLVVYDERTDAVHYLNNTAAVIFQLCDGSRDAGAIADELVALFGLEEPPLAETVACLDELAGNGLVV